MMPLHLVLLAHPPFLGIRSQSLFAQSLAQGLTARGHLVEVRHPAARARRWAGEGRLAKWAGYVDQYLLFPLALRRAMRHDAADTLYVFCDQALGPWLPAVLPRPHVVHCHDLLALRSALGDIAEHTTSPTGRLYQRYIRRGFRRARHFISISQRSRDDLHRHGGVAPAISEVVYNGLNRPYRAVPLDEARATLRRHGIAVDGRRCIVHVGNGQWYKNTAGVIAIYAALARSMTGSAMPPLWIVGPALGRELDEVVAALPAAAEVRRFDGLAGEALEAMYSVAEVLLVPSLAEGFGWPIAEALACGCPVITTGEAPMTEVGGDAALYLPRLNHGDDIGAWADHGAVLLRRVMSRSAAEKESAARVGQAQAARFDADRAVDAYIEIYRRVLACAAT